jgi:hypothetical protein
MDDKQQNTNIQKYWKDARQITKYKYIKNIENVATLALGLQRCGSQKEAWESHLMLLGMQESVKE